MKKILLILFLFVSSFASAQYDITFNSGYGIKWNAGSYVKSTTGTLYLKGVELNFRNINDAIKFNVDDSGNVDITGEYRINGVAISTGGSTDTSLLLHKYDSLRFALRWNNWDKSNLDTSTLVKRITSTDEAIARYEGTSGRLQNSGITINDSNQIILPSIVNYSTKGSVYLGSNRFLHFYTNGNGNANMFLGTNAGNFSTTSSFNGNYGIGVNSLKGLTTGYSNFALGQDAGTLITTGTSNFTMGNFTLSKLTTGTGNLAIGFTSMSNVIGNSQYNTMVGASTGIGATNATYYVNTGIGGYALTKLYTGNRNVAIGNGSLNEVTTGIGNIYLGCNSTNNFSGQFSGRTTTTGSWNIMIGDSVYTTSQTVSREMNVGRTMYGTGLYTDTAKIGIMNSAPNSTLDIFGSISRRDTIITSSTYTVGSRVYYVEVTYFSAGSTITLPTAVGCKGREYVIKNNTGGQTITMNTTSGEYIDGTASGGLTLTGYNCLTVFSNGTQWLIKSLY